MRTRGTRRRLGLASIIGATLLLAGCSSSTSSVSPYGTTTTLARSCPAPGPGADLVRCDLAGQDLSGKDLIGAKLTGANLGGADLSHANLTGADLQAANVTGTNFTGATFSNTTCPDGLNSNDNHGTCTGQLAGGDKATG